MKSVLVAVTALSLGSSAYAAALAQTCAQSDVCFALNIPASTASSGSGDIYFQISASTSYEWVALGQGSGMSGANIFVMYTSSDGTNVTVSPRLGTGYVQPQHDTSAKITLLEGSGVSGGKMTANVLCSNCNSWSGGSMDFTASSADWIYAVKSGSPLNSDSLSESISQHDTASPFTWSISSAKGGSASVNPFVAASKGSSSSGGKTKHHTSSGAVSASASAPASSVYIPATCTPIADSFSATDSSSATGAPSATDAPNATESSIATATIADLSGTGCPTTFPASFSTGFPSNPPAWVTSCFPNGPPSAYGHGSRPTSPPRVVKEKRDDGCPAGYASTSSSGATFANNGVGFSLSEQQHMILAHGVLACLAFVGLFPIGGMLIRLGNFTGLIWVHAALQCVAYLLYIVAFAMGVYMARQLDMMNKAHPIVGIGLFFILLGQPLFGYMHHRMFKTHGKRTIWSYAHLFHGRIAILLGMVNGGLGIQLAGTASMGAKIAYAVITGMMAVAYITVVVVCELKRRKRTAPPSYENSQIALGDVQDQRYLSSSDSAATNEYYAKS